MALNIEEIVLTNLEAVTNSRLRVDPHEARQLEDVKIPRYLDDGNVEDWAKTLSCGFCKTNLSLGDQGAVMDSGTRKAKKKIWVLGSTLKCSFLGQIFDLQSF